MRFALGIAVFSGMLGVTVFGLFFTPVFYVAVRWFGERRGDKAPDKAAHQPPAEVSSAPPTERVASTGS